MRRHHPIQTFYHHISQPLVPWTRLALALLVIPLVLTFVVPIWRIRLVAPQYPEGLYLDIYTYKVEAGNEGQHLDEINNLNHYIGMRTIDRAALSDLDWIPFALGILGLWTLRVAAIGDVRSLVDLVVLNLYVSLFALGRFVYMLYVFGHNLDPTAPVQVEPFMPPVFGTKQIANFTATSLPQVGSYLLGLFVVGTLVLAAWHLRRAVREARRVRAAAAAAAS